MRAADKGIIDRQVWRPRLVASENRVYQNLWRTRSLPLLVAPQVNLQTLRLAGSKSDHRGTGPYRVGVRRACRSLVVRKSFGRDVPNSLNLLGADNG